MIIIRCDAATRCIETQINASEHRSNRRYKLDHLDETTWDYVVGLLQAVEQADYVLSTYKDLLHYIKSQMVGKVLDGTAYLIFGGLINDMTLINSTDILVTG